MALGEQRPLALGALEAIGRPGHTDAQVAFLFSPGARRLKQRAAILAHTVAAAAPAAPGSDKKRT
ncbi:MAG: hypothetical protein IPM99_24270 [Rubrivivax sp.]|nr:hypothetical protein [Rubrivivax sp.]